MAKRIIPSVRLNSGFKMPIFGLGTWKSKPDEVTLAVKNAIDVGYRHIDCAFVYENEAEVGKSIRDKITEGIVKRDDLFVTSKVWNTFHRQGKVLECLNRSLKDLDLEYLDLYLIHWPMAYKEGDALFPEDAYGKTRSSNIDYIETWKGMEEAVKLGLVRSIGLANFNSLQIKRVLDIATTKPAVNQVEVHPYLIQTKLVEFCKSNGIAVTGYSPLGSADRPWAQPEDPKLLEDKQLISLGKKYKKTAAQVVLRWLVQRGIVAIPKSVQAQRLKENIDIFDFTISDEDMAYINNFDRNGRTCHANWNSDHPDFPFHEEF